MNFNVDTGDVKEIAQKIFSQPPLPQKSIRLSGEGYDGDYSDIDIQAWINELLMDLTMEGMMILFGHTSPFDLSQEEFFLLRDYTRSFCYDILYEIRGNQLFVEFVKLN